MQAYNAISVNTSTMQIQFLRMQSTICWELHNKVTNNSPKDVTEIAIESVYGMHLRMLLKMDLRVQMDAKSGQLKIKSVSESANEKRRNLFEVHLMMQFRVYLIIHLDLHLKVNFNIYIFNDEQKGVPNVALNGTLLVALELHLFMQLSIHKSVQNDSTF